MTPYGPAARRWAEWQAELAKRKPEPHPHSCRCDNCQAEAMTEQDNQR